MRVHYGAMIIVTGSLNLGEKKKHLSDSELAHIHDVIQKGIQSKTQASLKDLIVKVSKVVILNLEEYTET